MRSLSRTLRTSRIAPPDHHPIQPNPDRTPVAEPVPGLDYLRTGVRTGVTSAAAYAETVTEIPGLAARIVAAFGYPPPPVRLSVPAAEIRPGDWLHATVKGDRLWGHVTALHRGPGGVAVALSGAEAVLLPATAVVEIERPAVPAQRNGGGRRG
jgi:hypothetical protein